MKSLGISVNPKHWDFVKNKPKSSCPNKEYIQKIILAKEAEIQSKMMEFTSEQKVYTATTLANTNNCSVGEIIKIRLTEEEKIESEL